MPRVYKSPTVDAIVAILEEGPASSAQIAARMQMQRSSVNDPIRRLRVRGEVRIAEWEPPAGRGSWIPIYALGSAPDKPEPKPLTSKEIQARYRERNRHVIRIRTQARRGRAIPAWLVGLL